MSDVETTTTTTLRERALAEHEAWHQEGEARTEREYQRLADEMRASFEATFGVAPNYVAPEHLEVYHEGITFRYDRRYGGRRWFLFSRCSRCGAELFSSTIHSVRELGTELFGWDPEDGHVCRTAEVPAPSLDERLLDLLREWVGEEIAASGPAF